jgi:hypothetical protein
MGRFHWDLRCEDHRDRESPVVAAHLYFYYNSDAEYDEFDRTAILLLGSTYLDRSSDKWVTSVGYSMKERSSSSRFYKDQQDLTVIGEFDSLTAAQDAIREKVRAYFLRLAQGDIP